MGSPVAPVTLAFVAACGGRLPEPPIAPSSGEALVDVNSPPPAAHVEFVPERPRDGALWVDGQWTWGGEWRWLPGGWYAVPKDVRFAPWRIFRRADGSLVLAPPAWHGPRGTLVPAPPLLAPATAAHTAPEPETIPEEVRRPPRGEEANPQGPSQEEKKP